MKFTPLDLDSFNHQNNLFFKPSIRVSYLISSIFFLFSLGIFIYSLFLTSKPQSLSLKASSPKIKHYSPKFQSVEEIPFLVKYINNRPTQSQIYFDYLKNQNPEIEKKTLISEVNTQIFTYYVLSNFFNTEEPYPNDYLILLKKNDDLVDEYRQDIIKYTGYYVKIRFRGYYGKREQEIRNIFGDQDLRKLAEEKMNSFIQNNPHPSSLFSNLNFDPTLSQLNNNEKAIDRFVDNSFEDPPFDDPDFYQYLENAPENQYSKVYVLKTKNPLNPQFEEYAFLVFFIERKVGKNIPLYYFINSKLNEISYR